MASGRRAPRTAPAGVHLINAPFSKRTWREYAFLRLGLMLAPFALAYGAFTVLFTVGVAASVVGLFAAGLVVLGARGWSTAYRGMLRGVLEVEIVTPAPYVRPRGFWRTLGSMIGDRTGWRAVAFMIVSFPATVVGFLVSTAFLFSGIGGLTYWAWYRFLPLRPGPDGTAQHGGPFVDTALGQLLVALAGLVMIFLWPWIQRPFALLVRVLVLLLLGATPAERREARRASAAVAVDDADARLRRIERDLHDGTQARLVAMAMQVGEAKEQLTGLGGAAQTVELLTIAHASAKETLAELRELARGVHPPAIDDGLAVALTTLAARAALPVRVDVASGVESDGRLPPAIESIAYFTVAELVTNATKHARASGVWVLVERPGPAGDLRIRVRDNGRGGARVVPADGSGLRSGLAGLAERVRSVDGTLELSSPVGGPTVVTLTLPARVPARAATRVPADGPRAVAR